MLSNNSLFGIITEQASRLALRLVDSVSEQCDWVLYHVKCLGHDTSVRQHYKREH